MLEKNFSLSILTGFDHSSIDDFDEPWIGFSRLSRFLNLSDR